MVGPILCELGWSFRAGTCSPDGVPALAGRNPGPAVPVGRSRMKGPRKRGPFIRATGLWNVRRPSGRDDRLGILLKQEALLLEYLSRATEQTHIGGMIGVALLKRRPRVAGCELRCFGLGKVELLAVGIAAVQAVRPQRPARIGRDR